MAIAPTGAIYKSLIFDGEDSRNYGIYITGQAVYNAPERDVEMISIPGRNGTFALDKGRFQNIEVTYPAGIFANTEADFAQGISDFRNFLCSRSGYVRLTDEYNPDEYRMAVYKSGLEVSPTQLKAGEFDIVFDCKPQRYLLSGEEPVTIGEWHDAETASGSIASFEAKEGDAVKSLVVDIEPMQDLHGYDKPWAGGVGKNKLPTKADGSTTTVNGITAKFNADGTITLNGTATATAIFNLISDTAASNRLYLPAGNYILNGDTVENSNFWIGAYKNADSGTWVVSSKSSGGAFTVASGDYIFPRIRVGSGVTLNNVTIYPMIRLSSVSDATYEPYSNICPISGYSSVVVTVADDHDSPTVSNTYTINLSGTRYGGTLDVASGVLTVADANIASYNGETLPSTWISDRDVYESGTTPTTGAQVVYKLATPTTVQLTAQEVELLVGLNQIWANSGDVSVEYGTAPNVVYNPTLFEASPMLEVEGYGTININDEVVSIQNEELGSIKICDSSLSASVTLDTTQLNTGDVIYADDRQRVEVTVSTENMTHTLDIQRRGNVTNGSCNFARISQRVTKVSISPNFGDAYNGTSKTVTTTVPLRVSVSGYSTDCSIEVTTTYTASTNRVSLSVSWTSKPSTVKSSNVYRHNYYRAYSTKSILPSPMHIDLDIGEAYGVIGGEPLSFDNLVTLPAELPKLKSGANTITADNTVTDLKVVPRYWRI